MKQELNILILSLLAGAFGTSVFCMGLPPTSEIPFDLEDHFIVVKGSIGDRKNLRFVIDTGATYTVISKSLAKSLKLETKSRKVVSWGKEIKVREGIIDGIRLGEFEFQQVACRIGNLPRTSRRSIDGLIGLDILKRTNVTVDYEKETLILGASPQLLNFHSFYSKLPFIPVKLVVQGRSLTLILDTGAIGIYLFKEEVEKGIEVMRTNEVKQVNHLGGNAKARKILVKDASWQDSKLEYLQIYLIDIPSSVYGGADGILGPASLGVKRIQLDFIAGVISWEM